MVLGESELHIPNPVQLTAREQEILVLIADGLTGPQIAKKMFISPKTVDTHRMKMMQKMDAHSVANLLKYAVKTGLLFIE